MRSLLEQVNQFLRSRGRFAPGTPLRGRLRWLLASLLLFGVFYGAVMGSYSALAAGRQHQLLYAGVKVPMLLLVTFALCLPSFFVVNTIAGLRNDFGQALHALFAMQSCVTVVLGSLAPVTAVFYLSCANYGAAVLFNAAMFTLATIGAMAMLHRHYKPLIQQSRRHLAMLFVWFFLYAFVGIQMGWVLRPFIGSPGLPVAFFRTDAWGNAYVVVLRLIARLLDQMPLP